MLAIIMRSTEVIINLTGNNALLDLVKFSTQKI